MLCFKDINDIIAHVKKCNPPINAYIKKNFLDFFDSKYENNDLQLTDINKLKKYMKNQGLIIGNGNRTDYRIQTRSDEHGKNSSGTYIAFDVNRAKSFLRS